MTTDMEPVVSNLVKNWTKPLMYLSLSWTKMIFLPFPSLPQKSFLENTQVLLKTWITYKVFRFHLVALIIIWDKAFKNGPSKIFEGCLPQILLDPFLNTFPHLL